MKTGRTRGCCGDPRNLPGHLEWARAMGKRSTGHSECPEGFPYQVQPGDTAWSLGHEFGVDWRRIMDHNPRLGFAGRLRVGSVICIPTVDIPICPNGVLHRLQPDETLDQVAERYRVTVRELQSANPLLEKGDLFPGRHICIPV